MLVSVNWLKDYVDIDVPVKEFADRMILSGSNIETVEEMGNKFSKIQVAKIVKIDPHPNADKLVICQLDVGEDELLQVVTGAKNVFEGATVPVIRHGGKLPDGTVIKKGKLRGEVSNGMLCSAAEMGYDDKVIAQDIKDGIWILDDSFKPGTDIREALQLEDSVIDFEITPNRPDCLSMIGMAREAAAVFGKELKYPEVSAENEEGDVNDYISVENKRPDLCPRYTARVIKDVKIGPSPWWMQKRLMHGGMRPVNNIVDITNFVMMEYGQPLHAFDIRHLEGGKIIVDTAEDGAKFTTLDGTERELDSSMLMINDAAKPVAVAGVMGGLNSEILEDTNTVVLESANFNGDSVRLTAKKLGLRTEASGKFEKGIDANLCARAADRVCRLIEMLDCGTVVGGSVDVYPEVQEARPLDVRVSRINKVLGTDISGDTMVEIFRSLEMEADRKDDIIHVVPPTIRQDLNIEEDYVEEVARMYGYDKLPTTLPSGVSAASMTRNETVRSRARDILTAYGLDEILTYSFVNPDSVDKVNVSETDLMHRNFVKIINPLGEDTSVMRTMLIPSMMSTLERNYARGNKEAGLFEIGKIFNDSKINCDGMPAEAEGLCIGLYGGDADFFVLKGYIEGLLQHLGITDAEYVAESGLATYHPGRCANIISNGEMIGTMGQIRPDVAERYGISEEVYSCELLFSVIIGQTDTEVIYKPLPKYPAVERDIAMLVDEKVTVAELEKAIRENGGNILESVELFDVYRGVQIAAGRKSVAFALRYRVPDRTLTDEEVTGRQHKIVESLEEKFGAGLRKM
ncbi:MAG: phenylalanine--tRNA ligase subunit beta [Anaerovoracaceae bacterium]|nr:phenylalanine--tRNA ligase subunit beta [Bacillota bacterium]MDY2670166.1 phenylalanine--tRNA ligase subunit beta [Anaerovoracaceae bacterium]